MAFGLAALNGNRTLAECFNGNEWHLMAKNNNFFG